MRNNLLLQSHLSPILIPAFGAWLRHRRLELGMSCRQAATNSGIDREDWRNLEHGWVPFGNETFLRSIANTLEIGFDTLLNMIEPIEHHFVQTEDEVSV